METGDKDIGVERKGPHNHSLNPTLLLRWFVR